MLKIKELRIEKGLTQKKLASAIGVKNYTVANWEQGRTTPSVEDLCSLADFFECSIDFITGRDEETGNVIVYKGLGDDETKLLHYFKGLSATRKSILLAILQDLFKAEEIDKK